MFTIVYPQKSIKGAIYPAVTLQYLFWQKGITLPLANESNADAAEVVIRECDHLEKGQFTATTEGGRLVVRASDMFGFIAAADYLTGVLFADADAVIPKVSHTGAYTGEMLDRKTAGLRVIYHNIWFHDQAALRRNEYGITGALYELAEVLTFRPDVVGFNECVDTWREQTDLVEMLRANGYEEAKPVNIEKNMITPLFYNTETVRLVAGSCHMLSYGDLILDENHKAILPPAERYYEPMLTRYRSAVAGVFEHIASGKRFGACVTHLESNYFCVHQQPDEGDPLRAAEVELLIPFLKGLAEQYGVSFSVGGDYNSVASRIACKKLEAAGFENAHETAADKDDFCSCHGYPVYCSELNTYVDHCCPWVDAENKPPFAVGIDQIYTLGDIDVKTYRVLHEKTILCSSDHSPVLMDFDI